MIWLKTWCNLKYSNKHYLVKNPVSVRTKRLSHMFLSREISKQETVYGYFVNVTVRSRYDGKRANNESSSRKSLLAGHSDGRNKTVDRVAIVNSPTTRQLWTVSQKSISKNIPFTPDGETLTEGCRMHFRPGDRRR